jgi:hypothetical protein
MGVLKAGLILELCLLAACSESPAGDPPLSDKPWQDQTHEERKVTMKKVVFPHMKKEFARFDPKDFSKMTCVTCHGEGAKTDMFCMPNPELPKLPDTKAGFDRLRKEHPEVVEFMTTVVVPRMASFLGEEPYNPTTLEGFDCFRCHTKRDEPSAD